MFRFVLAAALVLLPSSASTPARAPKRLTLWAWERPEDLRFLPRGVDVRYLAATVTLTDGVSVHPRAQPLRVPPYVTPRPVVRIEARRGGSLASLSNEQRAELIRKLVEIGGSSLQLDFDARESEHSAYVAFISELRAAAPSMSVSITGLASWCVEDSFIERIAADEVVPQFFRMGAEAAAFRGRMSSLRGRCADSIGLAVDEELSAPASARRVYLFNPQPWTADAFAAALAKVNP